tara:strand:+ start:310 stop:465 length:156 start_codon:yes stop_codon:yes gene_type:complete
MKTTWKIDKVKKTTKEEDYVKIVFKDYRGEYTVKLDNPRQLLEELDKEANF